MDNKDLDSYIENAPDPSPELEGGVKEQDDDKEPVVSKKEEEILTSYGEKDEDGAGIVKGIMRKLGIGKDVDKDDEEEGGDIPDEFTVAALKQGWTEEQIVEFASDLDDDALLQLIPEILGTEEGQDAVKQKKSESGVDQTKQDAGRTSSAEDKTKAPDKTAKSESTNKEIAALRKELEEIKKSIGEAEKDRNAQEEMAIARAVNQAFDEASEKFEIFGKTEELLKYPAGPHKGEFVPTSPAYVARKEVWEKAFPFIQNGIPVNDAMEIALTWYKGKNLEQDVQRNLVKDLKKREAKLSAKRSGKETIKMYENEEERQADVVREAARKAGVKGEFGVD